MIDSGYRSAVNRGKRDALEALLPFLLVGKTARSRMAASTIYGTLKSLGRSPKKAVVAPKPNPESSSMGRQIAAEMLPYLRSHVGFKPTLDLMVEGPMVGGALKRMGNRALGRDKSPMAGDIFSLMYGTPKLVRHSKEVASSLGVGRRPKKGVISKVKDLSKKRVRKTTIFGNKKYRGAGDTAKILASKAVVHGTIPLGVGAGGLFAASKIKRRQEGPVAY